MKIRICFLVMALAPLIYYGAVQMAPAGRAATVSYAFHGLGKGALLKIEAAQDALSESDSVFNDRLSDAENSMTMARSAAHTAADQRDFARLVAYMLDVKQARLLMQTSNDPGQQPDLEQTNAARQSAETAFQ